MALALKSRLRHLPAVLGVALLIGAIYVVRREFQHLKLEDISAALSKIPRRSLVISFGWTILSYGVLTFYDRLGTIYAGRYVSYARAALASFCAYALSHNLGFAAVSGAAVRYRLYAHWGLTPLQIAKVVAFCSLTFGLGGMMLGGAILFIEPHAVPFLGDRLPVWMMYAVAAGMWAIVGAYVTLSRIAGTVRLFGNQFELPDWRMAMLQVLLATVDVAVTATIFYSLLPGGRGLTWLHFLGIYLASYTAGLVTNLPGGLGVFDTVMLLGLEPYMAPPQIVGAILIFRLYYYIIPLFLAGGLFAGNEIMLRGGPLVRLFKRSPDGPRFPTTPRWSEPDFAVAAATGVVALCGAMLLAIGVAAPPPDFTWFDPDLAGVVEQAGEFVPSLIGAALMVLSISLSQRVTLSWGATIVLLLLGACATAVQGDGLWIPAVLVLATMLVAPFRSAFYRHAKLLTGPLQASNAVPLVVLVICVLALVAFERHVRFLADNAWWEVVLSRRIPNSLRATVAVTVLLALIATWRLMRPGRVTWQAWGPETRLAFAQLGGVAPDQAHGLVWGEAERAAIPFRRVGRVMLALGDPVGVDSDRVSAIWRLRDLARQEKLDPAIWHAGRDLLRVYADLGLTALPLDGSGLPNEAAGGASGGAEAEYYLVCMAERDLRALLPLLPSLGAEFASRVAVV